MLYFIQLKYVRKGPSTVAAVDSLGSVIRQTIVETLEVMNHKDHIGPVGKTAGLRHSV